MSACQVLQGMVRTWGCIRIRNFVFEERIFVRRSHQLACIASNRADFVVERFAYARLDSGVVIRKGVQVSRVTESGRLKFQSKLGGGDEQIVCCRG